MEIVEGEVNKPFGRGVTSKRSTFALSWTLYLMAPFVEEFPCVDVDGKRLLEDGEILLGTI